MKLDLNFPEKTIFKYYIARNLAKGGLFKAGAMDNYNNIDVSWLSHVFLKDEGLHNSFFTIND